MSNFRGAVQYVGDTNIIQRVPGTNRYRVRIDFKDKGFTKKDFTIYVENNYGVTKKLTEALSVEDLPVTFTTSLDNSRIDGIYQVVNGFVGVPIEVSLKNTSTYAEGSYTWSVDVTNTTADIASLKNIVGGTSNTNSATLVVNSTKTGTYKVKMKLRETKTGQEKEVELTFF